MTRERDGPFTALEQVAARQSAEEQATRALAGARARLILGRDSKSAFFATLVLRLQPRPDWDVPTIATDGRLLEYNPEFVTGLAPDELVGVLAHEVMHCALAHPVRRGGRDPMLWNIACDLAINPLLRDAGVVLPAGRLMPGEGKFRDLPTGKSAEEYYVTLMKGDDDPSDGDGSASADPGGCGQVVDPDQGDPATTQSVEAEWKVAVVQAQQAASGRGPLPAGLGRTVEEVIHPPADWRSVLREFVATHAKNDYSWSRPNRRFIAQGLYLPGLHSEELGEVRPGRGHLRLHRPEDAQPVRRGSQCRPVGLRLLGDGALSRHRGSAGADLDFIGWPPGSRTRGGWRHQPCLRVRLADPGRHRAGLRCLLDRSGDRVPGVDSPCTRSVGRSGPGGRSAAVRSGRVSFFLNPPQGTTRDSYPAT